MRDGFKLSATSPACGAGLDPFRYTGAVHPNAIPEMVKDLTAAAGTPAQRQRWDMGLHKFSSTD